jgi:hypothetical protein
LKIMRLWRNVALWLKLRPTRMQPAVLILKKFTTGSTRRCRQLLYITSQESWVKIAWNNIYLFFLIIF